MGTIQHHAVVATTWNSDKFSDAERWLGERMPDRFISSIEVMNGYATIVLVPDGSKEGWDASFDGDERRALFIQYLEAQAYEDGSNSWDWVEVSFGELGTEVNSNCMEPA